MTPKSILLNFFPSVYKASPNTSASVFIRGTCTCSTGPEGGGGGRGPYSPLKNHKNKGFHSNTGADSLKDHKATKPVFNVEPSSTI